MAHVYIVKRIEWNYSDEWCYADDDKALKAFRHRDDAERYQRKLETDARTELMNTHQDDEFSYWSNNLAQTFGGISNLTNLSIEALRQRLQELNLPDFPEYDTDDMWFRAQSPAWWRTAWGMLRPDQYDAFWALFDRIVFFQVLEVEVYS